MRERRMKLAVTVAQVALLLLASTGVVVGSTAVTGAPGAVTNPAYQSGTADGSAELGASIVSVDRGETARLEATLLNTQEATIVVGGPDVGFNVTVTVTDENGDGVVPLEFRTDPVGMDATRFRPADDGDEYGTLKAAPNPDETLPAGEYPIAVYAGHGVSGEPTDVGTLVVNEQSPPPNASIDGADSTVTLHPDAGQAITGTTELSAGRNVSVRLRSSGESPFLMTNTATVGEDGAFTATFDLSEVPAPAEATASVYVDGEQIAGPVEVEVVKPQTTTTTSEPTGVTTTTGQPGFGLVVAIVALLGAIGIGRVARD